LVAGKICLIGGLDKFTPSDTCISHDGRVRWRYDYRVLQQYWFDGYRAIQSIQDKAQVEANGRLWHGATTLGKTCNAVLSALGCWANQKAVIHVVAFLVKGVRVWC